MLNWFVEVVIGKGNAHLSLLWCLFDNVDGLARVDRLACAFAMFPCLTF